MAEVLDRMKLLSPTGFENLVFDLVALSGLRNVVWRTPGADGGRDIEGHSLTVDFSGSAALERWYVECKRYQESLPWPQVAEKLSFATNHVADALLICTTATLSPQCKDEANRYAARRASPRLRFWEGAEMETRVGSHPVLLLKYRLDDSDTNRSLSVLPLVRETTKVVQSNYTSEVFGSANSLGTEYAACLVELIQQVLESDARKSPFREGQDLFDWVATEGPIPWHVFGSVELRAVLSALRYQLGTECKLLIDNVGSESEPSLRIRSDDDRKVEEVTTALQVLSVAAFVELGFLAGHITIKAART